MPGKIAVIIPVHNGKAELMRCLESLTQVTHPAYECTVVDDGSTDGTSEELERRHPWVRILKGDGNLWWSGANNLGIRDALQRGADYILTLNHDTIVDPSFLDQLLSCSQRHSGAIIGSKVMFMEEPTRIWAAGGGANWWKAGLYHYQFGERDSGLANRETPVLWFPGMGVLIPATVFAATGLYDSVHFPQYYGDAEFCFRAAKNGISLIYCPTSVIWNEVRNSGLNKQRVDLLYIWRSLFSRRSSRNISDTLRFYARHCPIYALPVCLATIYLNHFRGLGKRWLIQK